MSQYFSKRQINEQLEQYSRQTDTKTDRQTCIFIWTINEMEKFRPK